MTKQDPKVGETWRVRSGPAEKPNSRLNAAIVQITQAGFYECTTSSGALLLLHRDNFEGCMDSPPSDVLCIPAKGCPWGAGVTQMPIDRFQAETKPAFDAQALNPRMAWLPKSSAEMDSNWLQVVPYCAIMNQGLVFSYTRWKGGEERLAGKRSIGVGGHTEPQDAYVGASVMDCAINALWRELKEEIAMPRSHAVSTMFLGVIRDVDNSVGRVHIGLGFRLASSSRFIAGRAEVKSIEWVEPSTVTAENGYESWSVLLAQMLK